MYTGCNNSLNKSLKWNETAHMTQFHFCTKTTERKPQWKTCIELQKLYRKWCQDFSCLYRRSINVAIRQPEFQFVCPCVCLCVRDSVSVFCPSYLFVIDSRCNYATATMLPAAQLVCVHKMPSRTNWFICVCLNQQGGESIILNPVCLDLSMDSFSPYLFSQDF